MKPLFVLFLVFLSSAIFGQSFTMTDPDVVQLHELYLNAGRVFPYTSFPISDTRMLRAAEDLSDSAHVDSPVLDALISKLQGRPQKPHTSLLGAVNFVARPDYLNELNVLPDQELKDYLNSDPFLYAGLSIVNPGKLFLYLDIEGRQVLGDDVTQTNMPLGPDGHGNPAWRSEYHDIRRGVLAFFTDDIDIYFGRDKIQYGPNTSSLLTDPGVPWTDAFRMEGYLGNYTLSWKISTIFNGQAVNDVTLQAPYSFDNNTIYDNLVRFQYAGDRFRWAVSDQAYFVQANNAFQLGDFFPVFSWHNADYKPNNNSVVVDATVVPWNGVEISGQLGLDDINANFFGIPDDSTPTIDSEIVSLVIPALAHFNLEVGQTHYLWGSFDDNVALARAIFRVQLENGTQSIAMTSPYGPGSLWQSLSLRQDLGGNFSVGFKELLVGKKPGDNLTTTLYQYSSTLSSEAYDFFVEFHVPVVYESAIGVFTLTPGWQATSTQNYGLLSFEYHTSTVVDF